MWRNKENRGEIRQSEPNRRSGLIFKKNYFVSHFDPDHMKMKLPVELEYKPTYIRLLQSLSPNVNKANGWKIKKGRKQLNNNKAPIDIGTKLLKIAFPLIKFKRQIS